VVRSRPRNCSWPRIGELLQSPYAETKPEQYGDSLSSSEGFRTDSLALIAKKSSLYPATSTSRKI